MTAQRARTLTRPAGTDETRRGEEWRDHAACLDVDPETFYPAVGAESTDPAVLDAVWGPARAICDRCPVAAACLDDALTDEGQKGAPSRFGMRAGMTPLERFNETRRRYRAGLRIETVPQKTCAGRTGTEAGYRAHRRADEPACPACLSAANRQSAERRARRNTPTPSDPDSTEAHRLAALDTHHDTPGQQADRRLELHASRRTT